MGLLRLVAMGLVGYAAYELVKMMPGMNSPAEKADLQREKIGRGPTRQKPTGEVMSSTPMPTGGMEVTTGDPDGAAIRHRVGRGVIAR